MLVNNKIPQDEMSPKERLNAYFSGEEVDRLPCQLMLSDTGATYINESLADYYFNSEIMFQTEKHKIETLGFEFAGIGTTLRGIGEAYGSKLRYFPNRAADVLNPIMKDYKDLNQMEPLDPTKDGRLPIIIEANKKIVDSFGETINMSCAIPDPFTAAHAIRGEVELLHDTIKHPEELKELLSLIVKSELIFVKELYQQTGVVCGLTCPFISTKLISPTTFESIAFPYMEKLIDGILHITGKKPGVHLCGKSQKNWSLIKKLNISSISIDNIESLTEFVEEMGERFTLVGNVNPVSVIKNGTPELVQDDVKRCIEEAALNPSGYIVGSGCDLLAETPIENIKAFTDGVRLYGRNYRKGKRF